MDRIKQPPATPLAAFLQSWEAKGHEPTDEPGEDHGHLLPEDVWCKVRQDAGDPDADPVSDDG